MILHCLNDKLKNYKPYGDEASILDEYDLKNIKDFDEGWYWYYTAPYEGQGHIILRQGNLYIHHDMSHCSCYGPTENIKPKPFSWKELKEEALLNLEYYKEYKDLIEEIENQRILNEKS